MINKESLIEAIRLANISIDDLDLRPSIKKSLRAYDYDTLGKLLLANPNEIKKLYHIGEKTFDKLVFEIERAAGVEVATWWQAGGGIQ